MDCEAPVETLEFRLLNEFQREFPICARPYMVVAQRLSSSEGDVLDALRNLRARGAVSRIGATIAPGRLGAATLAALAVPSPRVSEVASIVNAFAEINHNYEREHRYNLWFVVTAPTRGRVQEVLAELELRARCGPVLDLPMLVAFHLDLGFDLRPDVVENVPRHTREAAPAYAPSAGEARILAGLQDGLALTPRPYAELAARAGACEGGVIITLRHLLAARVISRMGVIVRHLELGYVANAMAVWDVPDDLVATAGARLAQEQGVTLCYARRRSLPHWPYNLYCMVHGTHREAASRHAAHVARACGLEGFAATLLFSTRRFKQCAARYVEEEPHGRDRSAYREYAAG